jgi:tRNA pseudouridine38-40 synthase
MLKYAAFISYLGTDFCGWQKQKETSSQKKTSVQSTLEKAVHQMTGETVSVVGSGRTDAGVHALGQTVHFVLKQKEWDHRILQKGLNAILPNSIQAMGVHPVAIDFHAQRSAVKKQYSYYFQQGPCAFPHIEPYSWWIRKELNLQAMQDAVQALVGVHDFKPFQASGAKPGPTVREILEAEVTLQEITFPGLGIELGGGLVNTHRIGCVRVRLLGTGFLKQMVRGIAGTLLQVGEGRRPSSCIQTILETKNRLSVGPTAPARALWLEKVWYPASFGLPWSTDLSTEP